MNKNTKYLENNPWAKKYYSSKTRAKLKNFEHTMTIADFKELWFRDKAYELKEPSIDRIDNKKGYVKENCRYIELRENQGRDNRGRKTTEKQREHSIRWMKKLRSKDRLFTPRQVRRIRQLIAEGKHTLKEIANRYKCDRTSIAHIKYNKSYADIK